MQINKYRAGSRKELHHGAQTPQRSISGAQMWTGRTKELRTPPRADDPVRHGRFAAAGGVGFTEGCHSANKTLHLLYPFSPVNRTNRWDLM